MLFSDSQIIIGWDRKGSVSESNKFFGMQNDKCTFFLPMASVFKSILGENRHEENKKHNHNTMA